MKSAIPDLNPKFLILAQAGTTKIVQPTTLRVGSTGSDVQTLQTQLKQLGYYNGVVDGQYKETTQIAVAQFQKAQGLLADGIVGTTTQESLQAAIAAKKTFTTSAVPTAKPSTRTKSTKQSILWWSLLGLGILGSIGAVIYCIRWFGQVKRSQYLEYLDSDIKTEADEDTITPPLPESNASPDATNSLPTTASVAPKLLSPEKTSRLAKVNIVDELMTDLYSSDPAKRHKAIWDLGQQGDSRAIQPLVDLMMNADSQEHSLILAALGEISIRTLKPMNRALAISIQNESPQVRQNAIRDLTRVYDMMSQISQMLRHALEDPDPEVQSTARYALNQIHRIRVVAEQESLPEHQPKKEQGE
ncbi:MAG: peptidoglycan-binding protein [Aulosira sp. ZfuVER01]|nr:peptidoglycan-binding protein [Aulosira sp. ZfuVER01]MDZ7998449.1 peptidoglycan-binding protein [Aulosira sp. DedVER01a]MDZ8050227.1 peptidoglycan-binding protein [Aulosira sp. ZfuCHP01]